MFRSSCWNVLLLLTCIIFRDCNIALTSKNVLRVDRNHSVETDCRRHQTRERIMITGKTLTISK